MVVVRFGRRRSRRRRRTAAGTCAGRLASRTATGRAAGRTAAGRRGVRRGRASLVVGRRCDDQIVVSVRAWNQMMMNVREELSCSLIRFVMLREM